MNMLSLIIAVIVLPIVGFGIYTWLTAKIDRLSIIMLLMAVCLTLFGLYGVIVYSSPFGDLLVTIGGLLAGIESYIRRKRDSSSKDQGINTAAD